MIKDRRYKRIEVLLWAILILVIPLCSAFTGCNLGQAKDPQESVKALQCNGAKGAPAACGDYSASDEHLFAQFDRIIKLICLLAPDDVTGCKAVNSSGGGKAPLVQAQTVSSDCPAINFVQAPSQMTLAIDTPDKLVLTVPMYRQTDGSFTGVGFSIPAGSTNASGTMIGSGSRLQANLGSCSGIAPWTPAPHPNLLGDLPGIMARDSVVANLGGSAPYAALKIVSGGLNVVLDNQTTLGNSSTVYTTDASKSPFYIVVADLNGDGKRDVGVVNYGSPGTVSVLLGNGNGTLQTATNYTVGNYPTSMTAFDFNKDGRADLAVVNKGDNTVTILMANANGSMTKVNTYNLPGSAPQSNYGIAAADFDGDGMGDAIAYNDRGLALLHGNGDGSFQVKTGLAGYTPTYKPTFLVPGDFNKDNKTDLASLNTDGTVSILLNAGDGSFPTQNRYVAGTPYTTGLFQSGMFAMDFNDDGNLDLVLADGHPDALYPTPQFVTVLFGKGDGTILAAPTAYEVGNGATGMVMGDFNGDGLRDLVVSSPSSLAAQTGIWMLFGKSGGGFRTPAELPRTTGGYAAYVTSADLNGDGKPDLITIDTTNNVYTRINKGDGTFQAPTSYPAGTNAAFVTAGDVNGDGVPDILVAFGRPTAVNTSPPASPLLLVSKAAGGYNAAIAVTTGPNTLTALLSDVNGDGKLDLIAANAGYPNFDTNGVNPGYLSVSLGNGNGTFQTATKYNVGLYPSSVTLADVNGDGRADLIAGTTTTTASSIGVLFGNGNGTFQNPTLLKTYAWTGSVVVADLDGDQKPDLIVDHLSGDSPLGIMRGNGDGTFQPEYILPAGDTPVAVIAADFSGSGKPDLAVLDQAYQGTGSVAAFHNISGGSTATGGGTSTPVSAGPGAGTAASQSFTFTFNDPNGWQDLDVVNILINNFLDGRNSCYLAYSRSAGVLYLVPDAGGGLLPGITLGGSSSTSNGQCTVNSAGSSAAGNGDTLTLVLNMSFTGNFAGNKVIYLAARDLHGKNSGWQALGTWGVPVLPTSGPTVGGVSPARTTGSGAVTYTFSFNDSNGVADLGVVNILINDALNGNGACYLAYVRSANQLYLVNDTGTALMAPITLNGGGTLGNSQCFVSASGSLAGTSGNTLNLTLNVTFASTFAGNRIIYAAARSNGDLLNSGWQAVGSRTIQ
jgi:hypothetical protein